MDLNKLIEWYYNPPRANDIAAWAEIHRTMGTPDGSDHAMRQWAMKRMGQIFLEESKRNECDCGMVEHGRHHMDCPAVKRNNVAPTATLAQDEPQGQPAQPGGQQAASDPVADLEAMREDFAWVVRELLDFGGPRVFKEQLAKNMSKKWGLQ